MINAKLLHLVYSGVFTEYIQKHGFIAGIKLICVCYETGHRDEGLQLCDQIDHPGRYDLKQAIDEWRRDLNAMK